MKSHHQPRPTKTRAAIDRCLYDLYYHLYDGPRRQLNHLMKHHSLAWSIIEDLRTLHMIESVGTGKGQKHRWVGPYPNLHLGNAIEKLREERNERNKKPTLEQEAEQERQIDELLDLRNKIDAKLRNLGGQSRLF